MSDSQKEEPVCERNKSLVNFPGHEDANANYIKQNRELKQVKTWERKFPYSWFDPHQVVCKHCVITLIILGLILPIFGILRLSVTPLLFLWNNFSRK